MLQIAPQSMPAGLEVTDPLPVPALLIVRVAGGIKLKVAVHLRSAVIVTLPSEQSASPAQPLKREPGAGVAVSVTTCAKPNGAPQTTPQLMPAGIEVTVPLPVPVRVSVRVEGGIKLKVAVVGRHRDAAIRTIGVTRPAGESRTCCRSCCQRHSLIGSELSAAR